MLPFGCHFIHFLYLFPLNDVSFFGGDRSEYQWVGSSLKASPGQHLSRTAWSICLEQFTPDDADMVIQFGRCLPLYRIHTGAELFTLFLSSLFRSVSFLSSFFVHLCLLTNNGESFRWDD